MSHLAVAQVYWPLGAVGKSGRIGGLDLTGNEDGSGFVIGFNVSSFVVVVIAVLDGSYTLQEATKIVSQLKEDPSVRKIAENYTLSSPSILGMIRPRSSELGTGDGHLNQIVVDKEANLWLLFDQKSNGWPILTDIYCFGIYYECSPQIIFYEPPTPKNHLLYSVDPLVLFPQNEQYHLDSDSKDKKYEEGAFEWTLNQIKYSWLIAQILNQLASNSNENKIVEFQDTSPYLGGDHLKKLIDLLMAFLVFLGPAFGFVLSVLPTATALPSNKPAGKPTKVAPKTSTAPTTPPPKTVPFRETLEMLLTFSCLAQHASYRFKLLLQWPKIWKEGFMGVSWVHFYNRILLLIVDFLMGILLAIFLLMNEELVKEYCVKVHVFFRYDFLEAYIEWVMGWPAGLKLNEELDVFLVVLQGTSFWCT
eukprot:TRINITY_DN18688_c0_g1_i1.p1 TRINITY_DN18688_c0_g1~~TRINITY_DN18688_c0_g1_i1.p1  ORF type:complete len:427 (+),score=69.40 TRINITY_DN18688_c0_g1_i1:22-1281(+)